MRKDINMQATIEFDLPAEHDAYLDAINGTRWKGVIQSLEWFLFVSRETEENPDQRKAFYYVLRELRDGRRGTGLTYATVKSLKQDWTRMDKIRSKRLDDYLEAQWIPEMMAEWRKEVRVLRTIKERRQVILVTHNANIAVLGDAELLLPMKRDGDCGEVFDFGSVDKTETKKAALNILEGGEIAFQRRREIYGY